MKRLDRSVETLGPESELFKLHSFYARVESNYDWTINFFAVTERFLFTD